MPEKSEWFETWFDSEYYHILYRNRDTKEAENFISNLLSYLKLEKNATALDLGCGKGRHSNQLHKNNLLVTGMDLSPESIAHAQETYGSQTLQFKTGDMRKPFGTKCFDAIFNLFTSFGYFNQEVENQRIIQNVANALKPKGVFIQDFLNAQWVKNTLIEHEDIVRGDITFHIHKRIEDGFVKKTISFTDKGKDYCFQEQVCLLAPDDFYSMYAKSNLTEIAKFGSFDLKPFDIEYSPRLILISQVK